MRPAAIGLGTANAFYARRFKGGVFDQFEFGADVFRKTLIEVRPKIPGTYKGLIYCSNKNEANIILEKILPVLKENLGNDLSIGIKYFKMSFTV